jgi:uracil-DNA glycosylase family 4
VAQRATAFSSLEEVSSAVVACRLCPRLRSHCRAVALSRRPAFEEWDYWGRPVPAFGDAAARLLVVGLAPAAHGANRTGRMFTGDSSGDWLFEALHRFGFASSPRSTARDDGLELKDCFVTAALRCAPPGNRPERSELERCRRYLAAELALLPQVAVVVALGRIAYETWLRASGWWERFGPGQRPAFGHGRLVRFPEGPALLASYHPSRQNTNTGKLSRAMWYAIWQKAHTLVHDSGRATGASV